MLAWTRATGEDGCSVTGRSSPADALLPLPSLVICALKNLHPASRALQNPLPYRTLRVRVRILYAHVGRRGGEWSQQSWAGKTCHLA